MGVAAGVGILAWMALQRQAFHVHGARGQARQVERVVTYIDGFNLYFGLRSKGWRRYYWLDPQRLGANLLKGHQSLVATRYFTARIAANACDPGKHRRQALFLEAIETSEGDVAKGGLRRG